MFHVVEIDKSTPLKLFFSPHSPFAYKSTSMTESNLPIGSIVILETQSNTYAANASISIWVLPSGVYRNFDASGVGGVKLAGSWRSRGWIGGLNDRVTLAQRVS